MSATISSYHPAEYAKKLKKAAKHIPAFGWDTEPVVGQEEVIEEAFLDVFCDIVCGWAGVSEVSEAERECNWALVCFFVYRIYSTHKPPFRSNSNRTLSSCLKNLFPLNIGSK